MNSITLRFGNVYGKYSSHKQGVINKWIRKSIMNEEIDIYGNGNSSRDYIHVDDVCDGIIAAIHRLLNTTSPICETYHLGNNQEITLRKLSSIIETCSNRKLIRNFKDLRTGEVLRNCADFSLARELLNIQPKYKVEKEIPILYEWIKKNEFQNL